MGQENSSPSLQSSSPQDKSLKKLQRDFRQLINDERFYDIALECSDGATIFGCKAILATRSNIFNKLIFSDMKHGLSFDKINSNAMKIILEYLYTSVVKGEGLNVNNVVEVYYASIYFDLVEFQDFIIQFTEILISKDENANVGKKLLSECVEKFSLLVDNEMSRILVDWVAKNKLNKNENDSLSLKGLEYLLKETYDYEKPFATPEFEIWEYAIRKVTREINPKITPTSQEIFNNPQIKSRLRLLIKWIDLNRMDAEGIKKYVEPLNILPVEKFKKAYYSLASDENDRLGFIRGVPIFKWKFEELNKQLEISNGGFTVKAIEELIEPKSILGDLIFKGKGVYEWNILIKKLCGTIYIGVCDIEDLCNTDQKYHGWVLGSDGYVYHKNEWKWYNAKFKEGDKVTVHLDMKTKSCAFSINMYKKPVVSEWKNEITSRVYPIVSLGRGSIVHMEPYIPED